MSSKLNAHTSFLWVLQIYEYYESGPYLVQSVTESWAILPNPSHLNNLPSWTETGECVFICIANRKAVKMKWDYVQSCISMATWKSSSNEAFYIQTFYDLTVYFRCNQTQENNQRLRKGQESFTQEWGASFIYICPWANINVITRTGPRVWSNTDILHEMNICMSRQQ